MAGVVAYAAISRLIVASSSSGSVGLVKYAVKPYLPVL